MRRLTLTRAILDEYRADRLYFLLHVSGCVAHARHRVAQHESAMAFDAKCAAIEAQNLPPLAYVPRFSNLDVVG